jgi:hypothetical protein
VDKKKLLLYGGIGVGAVALLYLYMQAGSSGGSADNSSGLYFLPTGGGNPITDPGAVATPAGTAPDTSASDSINAALQAALAQIQANSGLGFSADAAGLFGDLPHQLFGAGAVGASGSYNVGGVGIDFTYTLTPAPTSTPAAPIPTSSSNVTKTPRTRVTGGHDSPTMTQQGGHTTTAAGGSLGGAIAGAIGGVGDAIGGALGAVGGALGIGGGGGSSGSSSGGSTSGGSTSGGQAGRAGF